MARSGSIRRSVVIGVLSLALMLPASAGVSSVVASPQTQVGPVWAPTLPLSPYQGWMWLSASADGGAFVLRDNADGYGGLLFRSRDFGLTWQPLGYAPFGGGGNGVAAFSSAEVGYGVNGTATLWRTTDGGDTWETVAGPSFNGAPVWLSPVAVVSGTDVVAAGGRVADTREAVVAVSPDRGQTWTVLPLGFTGSVWRLVFHDADHGLVLGSVDGSGWIADVVHTVSPDDEGDLRVGELLDCRPSVCTSVGMADRDVWFVGFREGRVLRTDDGGATFTDTQLAGTLPPPPGLENAYWVEGIEFADAEVGYAATAGHGMFRTNDGGGSWVREPSTTEVLGIAIGHLAVADRERAIAGGRTAVVTRIPD